MLPPQLYYIVKCFYLLLSAYQIRCGYPTRILGNFLCKGYNYVNMFLFKAFLAVPFLFELRTVMDWMWTDTSMTVFDWIKMEDIFAHIFQLKVIIAIHQSLHFLRSIYSVKGMWKQNTHSPVERKSRVSSNISWVVQYY